MLGSQVAEQPGRRLAGLDRRAVAQRPGFPSGPRPGPELDEMIAPAHAAPRRATAQKAAAMMAAETRRRTAISDHRSRGRPSSQIPARSTIAGLVGASPGGAQARRDRPGRWGAPARAAMTARLCGAADPAEGGGGYLLVRCPADGDPGPCTPEAARPPLPFGRGRGLHVSIHRVMSASLRPAGQASLHDKRDVQPAVYVMLRCAEAQKGG